MPGKPRNIYSIKAYLHRIRLRLVSTRTVSISKIFLDVPCICYRFHLSQLLLPFAIHRCCCCCSLDNSAFFRYDLFCFPCLYTFRLPSLMLMSIAGVPMSCKQKRGRDRGVGILSVRVNLVLLLLPLLLHQSNKKMYLKRARPMIFFFLFVSRSGRKMYIKSRLLTHPFLLLRMYRAIILSRSFAHFALSLCFSLSEHFPYRRII